MHMEVSGNSYRDCDLFLYHLNIRSNFSMIVWAYQQQLVKTFFQILFSYSVYKDTNKRIRIQNKKQRKKPRELLKSFDFNKALTRQSVY